MAAFSHEHFPSARTQVLMSSKACAICFPVLQMQLLHVVDALALTRENTNNDSDNIPSLVVHSPV